MPYQGIDDNLTEFGDIISQELATLMRQNIAYLQASLPIAEICPIMINIPGVANPDPNVWQECDGSEITNPNSPLRSQGGSPRYTPNMTDRYVKFAQTVGESGTVGGSNTITLPHNHGGVTGAHVSPTDVDSSNGAENVRWDHTHAIGSALTNPINLEPAHMIVKYYMRIQ